MENIVASLLPVLGQPGARPWLGTCCHLWRGQGHGSSAPGTAGSEDLSSLAAAPRPKLAGCSLRLARSGCLETPSLFPEQVGHEEGQNPD